MTQLKRSTIRVFKFIIFGIALLPISGASALAQEEVAIGKGIHLRASSTVPVDDDRVGKIVLNKMGGENASQQEALTCTANHLGDGFWLTAKHCLVDAQAGGSVLQFDGDKSSIGQKYFAEEGVDLAVFETDDPTIASREFDLPNQEVSISDRLTFIGFAASHSYASEAKVKVIEGVQDNHILWQKYKNSFKTISTTPSRTCSGDSGGAIYLRNEIVGVHSAGPLNKGCVGKVGSEMLHTSVFPTRTWIEGIVSRSAGV